MAREIAKRYLHDPIDADLAEKMVFVSGPRQVGKTTLALRLVGARDARHPAYLSWDDVRARPRIQRAEMPPGEPRVILDEIHKYARWRNLVKGLYDTREPGHSFLITGSARLDLYRRGGDSLHGRYHPYRLHPLSLTEVGGGREALDGLLRFGGFPEPFLPSRHVLVETERNFVAKLPAALPTFRAIVRAAVDVVSSRSRRHRICHVSAGKRIRRTCPCSPPPLPRRPTFWPPSMSATSE